VSTPVSSSSSEAWEGAEIARMSPARDLAASRRSVSGLWLDMGVIIPEGLEVPEQVGVEMEDEDGEV
jgi:hypothetical protein